MTPFKLHIIFGFALIIAGIIFDFIFVQWKEGTELLKTNPDALNSWAMHLYSFTNKTHDG